MSSGPANADKSDVVGTVLSGVCMVHCVSTPVLVTAAPAAASVLGGFHPVLLGGVALVGLWAFWPGFRRWRSPRWPSKRACSRRCCRSAEPR
ncbi:MAG: MerC domain-containing protein [Myxococcaceae bacterium]|nr:MerC domain-containing protein [Myxococcaceae bacterium]